MARPQAHDGVIEIGSVWINKRSMHAWMISEFRSPLPHEVSLLGPHIVVLRGTNGSEYTVTTRHLAEAYIKIRDGEVPKTEPKHASGSLELDEANLVHDVADLIYGNVLHALQIQETKKIWDWSQDVAKNVITEVRRQA
jgi:hypothetical protein